MDPQVFYEVLVPLMEVEGTATICISTPLGQFNFYSELTEVRDENGRRVFNVLHIPGTRPPPWKTQSSRSRIKAIYGQRSTLYKREIMGQVADDAENAAFDPTQLRRFFDKPPLTAPYRVVDNRVYVAFDPNGGAGASDGPGSETAIVSFVISDGRVVITGLESHPTPDWTKPRQMLYDHIDALKKQALFRDATFVLILEANLGSQAQICAQYVLRREPRIEVVCSQASCYGIFTRPGDPERYVVSMCDRLAVDGLFMHERIVCTNRFAMGQSRAERLASTLREFKRQLSSFRAVHIVPTSLSSAVRVVYTGKADKDGKRSSRLKDDMCMALLFGYFYYLRLHGPHKLVSTRNQHAMLDISRITDPRYNNQMQADARAGAQHDDDGAPPQPAMSAAGAKRKRE